jgi:penicillin amidase
MEEALTELEEQLGKQLSSWKWRRIHTLEHVHPIGRQKPMDRLFNVGPFQMPGGNEVINNLMFRMNGTGNYQVHAGPSKRRIVDFSNIESTYSILPTGQSGNVFSSYYQDQAELYNSGGFRKQMMNRQEIENYSESKLSLQP